ncbi:MAG: dihydropteroate synthase [Thermoplasmata archaeon]
MFNAHVLELVTEADAQEALKRVGVQARGRPILTRKGLFRAVKLQDVDFREAIIAKQEMLGAGGDAATPKGIVDFSKEKADVILLGTLLHFKRFIAKMRSQPLRCKAIGSEVEAVLSNYERFSFTLRFPRRDLAINKTLVMGVLNVTPDSFSDGGRYLQPEEAIMRAEQMVEEGADLVDVGAESTRPSSEPISHEEEWRRLEPVLKVLVDRLEIPISVDTYKPETAARALDLGVSMVNDVKGLGDAEMVRLVAKHDVPAVIMHMQGDPRTMQVDPRYEEVVADILRFLRRRIANAVGGGVDQDKLIVDPGIGFGKSLEHNLELLRRLGEFRSLGRPLLVGTSRKSFIGKVLDSDVAGRLEGSLATAVLAVSRGAHIVRVHDVRETVRAVRVADAILGRDSTCLPT